MQFSIKNVLAVAISMATFVFAVPQATVDAFSGTAEAAVPAESSVTDTKIDSIASIDIADAIPASSDSQQASRCCAFADCTVCADYGVNDCSPCSDIYPFCCA